MKTTRETRERQALSVKWTANLWEVGAPVRDAAKRIEWAIEDADKALAEAKALHAEAMKAIAIDHAKLEQYVSTLWTAEEIDAAKRGKILIDGKEVEPFNG